MKKIYQLEINTDGCNYQLWVNGLPADVQLGDTPLLYDLTLNPWLQNGPNLILVKLTPITGSEELSNYASFKGKLFEGVLSGQYVVDKQLIQEFSSPNFKEMRRNDEDKQINEYLLSENVLIQINYKNALYTDLLKVKPDYNELMRLYSKTKSMFESRQIDKILEMMVFKMDNYSNTVYKEPKEEYLRQREMLEELSKKEMVPIDFSYYDLKVDFGSKVFSMLDSEGTQPLVFIEDGVQFTFYPLYFGQRRKNEWEIIL